MQLVSNAISEVSREMNQRFDILETIWSREFSSALERQRDNAEAMAGHHSKWLDGISSSLSQNNTRERKLRQTLVKVSDQSDGLLSMSVAQLSEIQDLRLEMQGMRYDQAQWRHGKKIGVECSNLAPAREKAFDNKGYRESILRLCNLAKGQKREISSREAQPIIHDLNQIIASPLNDTVTSADTRYRSNTKRREEAKYDRRKEEVERKDVIHRIRDILGASRRLRLDRRGTAR